MASKYWADEGTYWESDYDSPETWASDGSWMWVGYGDEWQEGSYYEDGAGWGGNYDEENGTYHEDEHEVYTEEDVYGGGGQGRGIGRGRGGRERTRRPQERRQGTIFERMHYMWLSTALELGLPECQ
eukprot:3191171-Pyramimonas_sp.AAC.1